MTQIVVVTKNKSGIYAKLSVTLSRMGITTTNRTVEKTKDALPRFTLAIDAADKLSISTAAQLETIDGIVSVEIIDTPDTETLAMEAIIQDHSLPVSQLGGILDQLIQANPDIVGLVRSYTLTLEQASTHTELFTLGLNFGKSVANLSAVQPNAAVSYVCDDHLIPLISQFSFIERKASTLRISLCPFCRDSSAETVHCSFLHGVISGSTKTYPGWSKVVVKETSSQAAGHAECRFNIEV
ncbi:MAG: hypothetical protein GY820_10125 [Gammaproteobacteria bacterium]|nr:hypothetical protein [Gammaproteobacteria bacterium]